MNLFQSLNGAATFFIIAALINGVKDAFINNSDDPWPFILSNLDILLFIIFYIVLKLKFTFDDHKHFQDEQQDETHYRGIGFLLAVFSWIVWAISGNAAANVKRATIFLAISLVISTAWIGVHILEIRQFSFPKHPSGSEKILREIVIGELRKKWVGLN